LFSQGFVCGRAAGLSAKNSTASLTDRIFSASVCGEERVVARQEMDDTKVRRDA
jgi:hypothetical protein